MAVTFFGGPNGAGARVWSAGTFVTDEQDKEKLRARIRDLESLCTDVLVAGVDLGLPQHLLNQLWAAVGHGDMPLAYHVDLPSGPPPRPPLQIPDIPLTSSAATVGGDTRPKPPQAEFKALTVKKTVAVVDDDPMMLDVLARILQRENYELLMGGGGPEIMQKLDAHHGTVDLLVTDYSMPDMQGRELAEKVRERFPGVKVLYQTGFSDRLFEDRVELEDGEAFLEKPFTARGLREAARLVLFGSINP